MTTAEMLTELREVLADELRSYGVSDTRLLAYLNEGQDKFCEQTGFFHDSHTFSITTEAGVARYVVDPRVIKVYDVYFEDRALPRVAGRLPAVAGDTPCAWETVTDSGTITIYPIPTGVITLALHVWRYPLNRISSAATGNPELPPTLQRACIEWAAYKCYRHHDIELANSYAAVGHRDEFRRYVLEARGFKASMDGDEIRVGVNPVYQV